MKIKSNFSKDLNNIFKNLFIKHNFNINNIEDNDFLLAYFNYFRRNIQPYKRKVYISDCFSCPKERLNGWNTLKHRIENGKDITNYQSKQISDIRKKDLLLNDWGIHHLHLGESLRQGWIERTNELVFALITEEGFYAINVFSHGNWTNKDLIEIIHQNWPRLIERYKYPNEMSNQELSDKEHRILREKHINTTIKLKDGTAYFSPGSGILANGYCANDYIQIIKINRFLDELEKIINNKFQEKYSLSKELTNIKEEEIECNLYLKEDDNIYLYFKEDNSYILLMHIDELLNIK